MNRSIQAILSLSGFIARFGPARRERDDSRSLDKGQSIAKDIDCIDVLGSGRGEGGIKFLGRGRLHYRQSHAQVPGCAGYLFV
jgi:hypothetical protein